MTALTPSAAALAISILAEPVIAKLERDSPHSPHLATWRTIATAANRLGRDALEHGDVNATLAARNLVAFARDVQEDDAAAVHRSCELALDALADIVVAIDDLHEEALEDYDVIDEEDVFELEDAVDNDCDDTAADAPTPNRAVDP